MKKKIALSFIFFITLGSFIWINFFVLTPQESAFAELPIPSKIKKTSLYDDNEPYDKSTLIIKFDSSYDINNEQTKVSNELKNLGVIKLEFLLDNSIYKDTHGKPIFADSGKWFKAILREGVDSKQIIEDVYKLMYVIEVELNYISNSSSIDFPNVIDNPKVQEQWHLKNASIQDAWYWLEDNEYNSGGLPSVTVAVIDTGVDYTHLDLSSNMWINPKETQNGIDDDGNGFIDDIHGVNVVSDSRFHSGNPMDDHGHGTHVAGIIAASNNKEGIVGVAYNVKIMAIKAGNSSGFFLQTDIAEGILYAYENGADVINMSFGGSAISSYVQEALTLAYTRSVLVAAAGNSGLYNQAFCLPFGAPIFPAAYPFVIGVMSHDENGLISSFSNKDCLAYNMIEYDVYAPGERIISTLPGNRYASWSGTSMAAPVVSGIAALIRSVKLDINEFPNKYVMGQIIATGDGNSKHLKINALKALTTEPTPNVKLFDYYLFDDLTIDANNNDDGILDSGETIHIGLILRNRWGMAKDVKLEVDSKSAFGIDNPYLDFITSEVDYQNIGTLNEASNGLVFENNIPQGVSNPIKFKIKDSTPNDMSFSLNVKISFKNALKEEDEKIYETFSVIQIQIRNGVILPSVISEDMTLTKDKYWIVPNTTLIREGVTVNVEPGTNIQFWTSDEKGLLYKEANAKIIVDGILNFNGTLDEMIHIFPSGLKNNHIVEISERNNGVVNINYTKVANAHLNVTRISHSSFYQTEQYIVTPVYNNPTRYEFRGLIILADYILSSKFNGLGVQKFGAQWIYGVGAKVFDSNQVMNSSINIVINANRMNYTDGKGFVLSFDRPRRESNENIEASFKNNKILNLHKFFYDPFNVNGGFYAGGNIILSDIEYEDNVILLYNQVINSDAWGQVYSVGYYSGLNYGVFSTENNSYDYSNTNIDFSSSYWGQTNVDIANYLIKDMYDNFYAEKINYSLNNDAPETTFPFVTNVFIEDLEDNKMNTIGNGNYKFSIEFNRDMDTTIPLDVRFGSSLPYAEYKISGEFVNNRLWEGTYYLVSSIESGYQYFNISNGHALDNPWLTLSNDVGRFIFNIDNSEALALTLQGSVDETGIHLTWVQDDFDTIAGYNIYRRAYGETNYSRINSSIIPNNTNFMTDYDIEPGKLYEYYFTVVLTDFDLNTGAFAESDPSGQITIRALDTLLPNIYHTPTFQAFAERNMIISATILDNVAVTQASVYFRTTGETTYRKVIMSNLNNRFNGIISALFVKTDGIEYYIEAFDGVNYQYFGTPEQPVQVQVTELINSSAKGDVNADGVVDVKDALMILRAINGFIILTNDEMQRADLNGDGKLSSSEALVILQYAIGKRTTLN